MRSYCRSPNDRDEDKRSNVQQVERIHRRHDQNLRQLSILQPEGVAVLQVRRSTGGVLRQQDQIFPRQTLREQQVKEFRIVTREELRTAVRSQL